MKLDPIVELLKVDISTWGAFIGKQRREVFIGLVAAQDLIVDVLARHSGDGLPGSLPLVFS